MGAAAGRGWEGRSGPHRRGVHGQDAHVGRGAASPAATDGKVPAVDVSHIILYIPCPRFLDELIEFKSFPSAYSPSLVSPICAHLTLKREGKPTSGTADP